MESPVFEPLTLACGSTLPNRLVKAAMDENMAVEGQVPGPEMFHLYERWSRGGVGTIMTGNVMVHAQAMTGPGGIVLDDVAPLEPFRRWAEAIHVGGAQAWMQISHPGRQVNVDMPGVAWAPSAIGVNMGKQSKRFPVPTAMSAEQIEATVDRFATTARRAEEAGFDGVEVHAAHGYLISQFLSPLANVREDQWGGSLENRARFLLDVVRAIRSAVSSTFAVAVKLNSADFQRGGFEAEDAHRVIEMLAPLGVDVVELSGGNYESPAMNGPSADERTMAREAYFLDLARDLAANSPIPLMLTGGVTRLPVAEEVLASGVALVGMGTALSLNPDLPNLWHHDRTAVARMKPVQMKDKALASIATLVRVIYQLRRLAAGQEAKPDVNPYWSLAKGGWHRRKSLKRYRRWLEARGEAVERD